MPGTACGQRRKHVGHQAGLDRQHDGVAALDERPIVREDLCAGGAAKGFALLRRGVGGIVHGQ